MGVELFIIASGFGLYYSYLSRKDPWPAFYKKRAVRVLPLYYFFLLFIFGLSAFVDRQAFYVSAEGLKALFYHLLLLQTFNKSHLYYALFYFVAIIFQLYLLFPALIKLMKNPAARLPILAVFLISSSAVSRILVFNNIHFAGILITDFLPFFFLGMMIAQSVYSNEDFHKILFDRRASLLMILLLLVVVSYCVGNAYFTKEMRRLIALLVFLSLPFVFDFARRLRAKRVIAFVAYTAYPFYLMHMLFINRLNLLASRFGLLGSYPGWISVGIISFLSALAAAYATQKGYDRIITIIDKRKHPGYNT
jgi:peptidoglycan/LPS O-acetylase OafA/YrhL